MKSHDENPVDNLCSEDFVLAIQTPFQANIMKKHTNGRVICINSTHGTNGYDFTLISLLIVDEYGEGFPVGWCISNREDQFLLINFFNAIKKRIGVVTPAWLMTDLAEQFYSAWVASFKNKPEKLVCVWHVDRARREKLKDSQLQATIYHNLRLLLEENYQQSFELLLWINLNNL